jgi:glycosyltransferase involved in cell wall biosynthesis
VGGHQDGEPGLRILQVVGFLGADGAYGGPTVVALGQCAALAEMGHVPTLLTGWDGVAGAPSGFRVERRRAWKLVRRSFASLVSPAMLLWVARRGRRFDVVHVHLARDLLTLPIAALALILRVPLVVQTHGMIIDDPRRTVRTLDAVLTRRVLRRAAVLIALTAEESAALHRLGAPRDRIVRLGNAAPTVQGRAQFSESSPLVLFVSRLASRKRPVAFVEAAARMADARRDVRFEIWGPDEGQLTAVQTAIRGLGIRAVCSCRGAAAIEEVQAILRGGQVLILPSFAEPYPMVVLEALALGLPTVITTDTGISARLSEAGAAVVTSGAPEELAAAALHLVGDRAAWLRTSEAAREIAVGEFGPSSVASLLVGYYERALGGARGGGAGRILSRCRARG